MFCFQLYEVINDFILLSGDTSTQKQQNSQTLVNFVINFGDEDIWIKIWTLSLSSYVT